MKPATPAPPTRAAIECLIRESADRCEIMERAMGASFTEAQRKRRRKALDASRSALALALSLLITHGYEVEQ